MAGHFIAIVPARLASTRLPRKPLADLGGLPMVVRVAQRAAASGAARVVVAADADETVAACARHGVEALLTSPAHLTGTDRLAEAAALLRLPPETLVVNVQGDEPLIPPAVVGDVAALLARRSDCAMATAAHPLADAADFFSPHVVKVVTDRNGRALLFSRAPIPWARDAARESGAVARSVARRRHCRACLAVAAAPGGGHTRGPGAGTRAARHRLALTPQPQAPATRSAVGRPRAPVRF